MLRECRSRVLLPGPACSRTPKGWPTPLELTIELFKGARAALRPFFEMADDSAAEIDDYIEAGEVFVAQHGGEIVAHIQTISRCAEWEIKSLSVLETRRRQGIGTMLVRFVLDVATSACSTRLIVGTATADTSVILFYERLGFGFERIERNVFTAERGYPAIEVNGIPVCDRVWLSMALKPPCRSCCLRPVPRMPASRR